jgi:hypothetical protein
MSPGACRALVVTLISTLALAASSAATLARSDQLAEDGRTVYRVDPARGLIVVSQDLILTNRSDKAAPRTIGPIYVEDGAKVAASSTLGRPRISKPVDVPGPWQTLTLTLPRSIQPNQGVRVHLSYTLRGTAGSPLGAPRSDDPFRLGAAYAYYCVPGQDTDTGVVRTRLVKRYVPTVSGDPMERVPDAETAKELTLSSNKVSEPIGFLGCVEGVTESLLLEKRFSGPDRREVLIQGWPDDQNWVGVAESRAEPALERLATFLDQPIPGTGRLIIRESPPKTVFIDGVAVALGGYAGGHATPGVVQLSEAVDLDTIDHEMAHAWFGADRFPDDWLREGLAAWAAAGVAGETCEMPGKVPNELDLGDWQFLRPGSPNDVAARVRAQEQVACALIADLAARMGPEAWDAVVGSLLRGEEKYVGSGEPGLTAPPKVDWAEFLDAVDERGLLPTNGIEDLDYAQDLLKRYRIADDASLLAERSEARALYHNFLAAAEGLAAPAVVREHMDDWRFAEAKKSLETAQDVLLALFQADDLLPDAGVIDILRPDFEAARSLTELNAVEDQAGALLASAEQLVGPLRDLRAASGDWGLPSVVQTAIVAGEFEAALAAITPAITVAQEVMAADLALPEANLRELYRQRYVPASSIEALQDLATQARSDREQAEAAGVQLSALRAEGGDWAIPPAIANLLSRGQMQAAIQAIQDSRATVHASDQARIALPEANLAEVIRPRYEGAATAPEVTSVRIEAEDLARTAKRIGDGLQYIRDTVPGWAVPPILSEPVAERDFETAAERIAAARSWLEDAARADQLIAGANVLPDHQAAFEAAKSDADIDAGLALAQRQVQGAELVTQFGLLGTDLSEPKDQAIAAVRAGDVPGATNVVASIDNTVNQAARNGGLRLAGLVFIGVALFGVLGLWTVLRRDKRPPWAKQSRPPWAR